MKRQYKVIIVALGVVAILITAVAITALATQNVNATEAAIPTGADYQAWGCPAANGNYEAVASLLGMTAQEIETQLEQGKSLVEIAASNGVNEDQLVAVIFTPMKQYMQQQVDAGAWTQAQMDSHLTLAEQHIRQLVNARGNNTDYGGCSGNSGMMSGNGGMMGGGYGGRTGSFGGMMRDSSGMMDDWGANSGGSFQSGGMMGGGFRGMMGSW